MTMEKDRLQIAQEISHGDAVAMATLLEMIEILEIFADAYPEQTEPLRARTRRVLAKAIGEQ